MEENKNGVKEFAHIKGALEIIHRKADGSVSVRRKDNLILNAGFDFIADAIGKSASRPNVMSHIAVGTGTTEVAATQTALVTELSRKQTISIPPARKFLLSLLLLTPAKQLAQLPKLVFVTLQAEALLLTVLLLRL